MSLFDRSMVPGHLDKVLEELEGLDDRDGQGNAAPEIRKMCIRDRFLYGSRGHSSQERENI